MLINLRNALMAGKRLPYDAEVEYLESSGTQWVDTGVLLQFPISANMTLAMVSPYGTLDSLPVFGFRYGGGSASSKFAIWFSKSQLRFALNYGSYDSSWKGSSVQSGQVVHLRTDGAKLYIDGSLVADGGTVTTSDASNTLTLFQMRDTSSVANRGQCVRYYSCKLYDANGVLVRDFIPVRKGTVGYLYDRVTRKLFGNAGTGDFVIGPDVVPVEYIESTGTQYIDTGVVPGPGLDYSISFAFTSISSYSYILGAWSSDGSNYYDLAEQNNNLLYAGFGTISQAVEKLPVGVFSTVEKRGLDIYVVGGRKRTYPADIQSGSISSTILLFGVHRNYGPGYIAATQPLRVKSFSLVGNDTPVRNFLPVRVGAEGAMMDVLTRRIYRNAGTGAFGYGNDLKYPIPAE